MADELDMFDPSQTHFRAQLRERLAENLLQRRAEARRIGDVVHTADLELAAELEALGFDCECARVLDLMPLVHVAWADGKIQRSERALIRGMLEARGLARGDAPYDMLEALLEERPSVAYMEASLSALARLLGSRGATAASVLHMCIEVAEASGGIFGFVGAIDTRERALLEELAQTLGPQAQRELARRLHRKA